MEFPVSLGKLFTMKLVYRILILIVALTVLSVWTFRMKASSIFRGGSATNMIEEFEAYGLSETQMYVVGTFKILAAILLLLGLRFPKLVVVGASTMGVFMIGAISMPISIGDGFIPTLPSSWMLFCCITILLLHKRLHINMGNG